MKKKLLSLLLVAALIIGVIPISSALVSGEEKSALTKTAEWVDGEKHNLKINLESEDISDSLGGNVLFLGGLCPNHALTRDDVEAVMTETTKYANIDFKLFQTMKDEIETPVAYSGSFKKGTPLSEIQKHKLFTDKEVKKDGSSVVKGRVDGYAMAGSAHHTLYDFARELVNAKKSGKSYDFILLEFDGMLLSEFVKTSDTSEGQVPGSDYVDLLNEASDYIKDFYKDNKVAWIVPKPDGTDKFYYEDKFDGGAGASDSQLKANIRSAIKILAPEDLGANHTISDKELKNQTTFYSRITESEKTRIWTTYGNKDGVAKFLKEKFGGTQYKKVVVTDVINDGFLLNEETTSSKAVIGQIYDFYENKWVAAKSTEFSYDISKAPTVVGTFTVEDKGHTKVRMVINAHVDEENDPFIKSKDHIAETNKGNAKSEYYVGDSNTPRNTYEAPPPELKRIDCKITTTVTNGTMKYKTNNSQEKTLNDSDSVVVKDHSGLENENDVTFNYTPDTYYELDYIKIDGTELTEEQLKSYGSSYTFNDVDNDHSIEVAYKPLTVDVSFNTHGATSQTPAQQTINMGSTPTKPADPTKPGYTFKYWSTDEAGQNEFHFVDDPKGSYTKDTVITDTTLHAQYTEDDVTITYSVDSEVGGGKVKLNKLDASAKTSDSETIKADNGTAVGATPIADTGYTFDRWEKITGPAISSDNIDSTTKKLTPPKNSDSVYETAEYRAFFTKNQFTVQFENYGLGTKPENKTVGYNEYATSPGNLSQDGYAFEGWYTDDTFSTEFDFANTQITEPTTIYAKWNVTINYVSTDDAAGSVSTKSETFEIHKSPSGSKATSNKGYNFVNWTDKATDGTEQSTSKEFTPEKPKDSNYYKSATYYACFTKAPIKITYKVKEGEGTVGGKQTVEVSTNAIDGDKNGCTAAPAKGYRFVKWADASGNKLSENLKYVPTVNGDGIYEEATYYAYFEKAPIKITYKVKEGEGTVGGKQTVEVSTNAIDGHKNGCTAASADGYYFVKWTDASGNKLSEDLKYVPTVNGDGIYEEATYYAYFEKSPIKITYKVKSGKGTVGGQQITEVPTNAIDGDKDGCTAAPAEHYSFVNWTDKDGNVLSTKLNFKPSVNKKGIYESATYYANFKIDKHTVKFELNGHGSPINPQSVNYGSKAKEPTEPTESGYKFLGWYKDKDFTEKYDYDTPVTEDITLYAKWDVYVQYVEPTGPNTPSQTEKLDIGGNANPPEETTTGYDLKGWYCDPEFTIPYDPDKPITKPTKLYAKWVEKAAPLHYDLAGGEYNDNTSFNKKMTYTLKTLISSVAPVRKGYIFKGWATSEERAKKGIVDFRSNDLYKNVNIVPEEATVYAVWAKKAPSPKTSDIYNSAKWFVLEMFAIAGFVFTVILRKKKNGEIK